MTKLLVAIDSEYGLAIALAAGADIIDVAVGNGQDNALLHKTIKKADGRAIVCATTTATDFESDCDMVRIPIVPRQSIMDNRIAALARIKPVMLALDAAHDIGQSLQNLPQWAEAGIYGVMLETCAVPPERLTRSCTMVELGTFVDKVHRNGLVAALGGGLEAPDIPRLLPYGPDILGFHADQPLGNGVFGDETSYALIRSLIPCDHEEDAAGKMAELGTDRIFVRDLVLSMHIGAYRHELGEPQNVRFSVTADVARISVNPEDMRHIFSYDLIIDGIRRLAALGHVDLVETLAERIAAFILAYPRVSRVMVRVEKLDLGPGAVGVEIERVKKNNASINQFT